MLPFAFWILQLVKEKRSRSETRKRLLIVAFHYPPIQGSSGVQRALAFSKYLREFGWEVSVLTVAERAHEKVLADNLRMIPDGVRVIRAWAWDASRHFSLRGRYPSVFALPDRWSTWIPCGVVAAMRAIEAEPVDAVFSTFPIASAHVIGRILHRRLALPWIADFRDPMATATYPLQPSLRKLWTRIQATTLHEASRITVTTPGAARHYRDMFPEVPQDRIVVIENGFDPELFPSLHDTCVTANGDDEPTVLLHSGILYPRERNPLPFFRAIRRLIDEGRIIPGRVCVRLRASGFENQYRKMIDDLRLASVVSLEGPLPYAEALREMQSASALLLFQADNCNDQIPAKAYEYLYAGRPILGIADPSGDTGRLLQRFGVPGIARLESEDAIYAMLRETLPQIAAGSYPIASRALVLSVSRRAGAQQLAALLDETVAGRA